MLTLNEQTEELEASSEDTFIVSASSPIQMELISGLDTDKPVFVEGGFKTWLNGTMLKYFTLRSETSETFKKSQLPIDKEEEEKSKSIGLLNNAFVYFVVNMYPEHGH